MSILVTGSAGHLGEAILRSLKAQGRQAQGVDIKASAFTDHIGSITNREFVRNCLKDVQAVIHTATLHKPHIATHTNQDFIDTNVSGTLVLLEEAVATGITTFVYTSTTSTFGAAMNSAPGEPATWITEEVTPIPKNIYGVTKIAAENLCEMFARKHGLGVVILRTSRFFPEADDDATVRGKYSAPNVQANELLYRRVEMEDVVDAHILAIEKAPTIAFGRYIISATTPFTQGDRAMLHTDAPEVVKRLFPDYKQLFASQEWTMFPHIDRVYVNSLARTELGWQPKYDFAYVLKCLGEGTDFRSPLSREVGSKGYHDTVFEQGPYPAE
ncbi:UDP-glucose 4-epimerase [Mucilaginibacter lappiensis]|uniref:UDP-glucose 4-epimerase n=1 Tax=Mucilaginibacter lappiensis TaxID=354630 RepID=A0ABR6PG57_9SPHI|nr:NAD(P)-dependent oxidoreductase [Mucilaginibacter lappiensis]MBB6108739.1 UDP-glucose 4-epimerase [Mucilaginibacter lappiensis]SIQ25936.1 UDP-glucose 4-epimerase [Mucilaginibacter lappiensis]